MAEFIAPTLIISSGSSTDLPTVATRTNALTSGQIGAYLVSTNVATDSSGVVVSTNAQDIYFAQYTGVAATGTIKSYPLMAKDIIKVWKKTYVAAVQQVSYVGFDGSDTTKTLSFLCDTDYSVGIRFESEEINNYFGNAGLFRFVSVTTDCCESCDAGCTPVDCKDATIDMVNQINKDSFINQYVSAVMVTDGSFSASSAGVFTVTNGADWISVVETSNNNDAGKYAADASTIAVGDFLRIGGTGNTSAVYVVEEVGGSVNDTFLIRLNTPYQGSTGTVLAANVGVITATTVCGIKLTGLSYDPSTGFPCSAEPLFLRRKPVTFVISPGAGFECVQDSTGDFTWDGFATYTTPAVFGNGTGAEVYELENEVLGYKTKRETFGFDPRWQKNVSRFAVAATNYDLFYIRHYHTYESSTIIGTQRDQHLLILATPNGSTMTTSLTTLLNAWIVAEPISLPTI